MKKHRRNQGDDSKSDTEVSNLTTTSDESSASGAPAGLLGRMMWKNNKPTSIKTHSSSSSKPLHYFADQDEDIATTPGSSWALSPSISSIPEEQGEDRPPINNKKSSSSHKEVISPSLKHLSACTLPSPASQRSLGTSNMDNSSVAMESATSGMQSVCHSEITEVVRNTSGVPLPPNSNQRGSERGAIPIHHAPPPLCLIPSGRALDEEDLQHHQHHQQPYKQKRKQPMCRGTQGWIIGLLVALFIFGLITLVVSFVLSSKANQNDVDTLVEAPSGDDIFDHSIHDDDTLLVPNTGSGANDTAIANVTGAPSPAPTSTPSLDEENALFADAVEELLIGKAPTSYPTSSPTTTSLGNSLSIVTNSPSASPSPGPTNGPTAAPTTALPTGPESLLHLDATFTQEAQLWGESNGDAAGSSTVLSGNGRILLMGSPNSDSTTTLERTGQVHVYERIQHQSNGNTDWMLRATLQGQDALNQLGFSLAANYDGSIVAVSEPTADNRRGRVTIYEWQADQQLYEAQQILMGSETTDHFGISMSLSDDGRRLAVGSPYHSTDATPDQLVSSLRGQAQVFEYSIEQQGWKAMETVAPDTLLGAASLDWFGWSVSLSRDGQVLAVGAPRNTEFGGYVQCFRLNDSTSNAWEFMGPPILNLVPPVKLDDRFGHAISVTTTGSHPNSSESVVRVAVGAPWKDVGNTLNSGMAAIYEWHPTTSTWAIDAHGALGSVLEEKEPGFYHQVGYSMKMDGDVIAVGVPGWGNRRGMVDLFWLPHAFGGESNYDDPDKNPWNQLADRLTGESAGDDFGFSVSLVLQHEEEVPSSLVVASGAIMVSTTATAATGYSMVYHRDHYV